MMEIPTCLYQSDHHCLSRNILQRGVMNGSRFHCQLFALRSRSLAKSSAHHGESYSEIWWSREGPLMSKSSLQSVMPGPISTDAILTSPDVFPRKFGDSLGATQNLSTIRGAWKLPSGDYVGILKGTSPGDWRCIRATVNLRIPALFGGLTWSGRLAPAIYSHKLRG
ncbi:hypothetical protein BDM02DRAFT_2007843 [Thelephora ganbajun]|uniref:Uncharacterized protein n=1 Tax=Thelephora ganbajun TaxID=370292 RepID=A0ACB6YYV1_THEGA|nr:hypothetical protein BDM02DRAFT_2007843 [Thelephora ganbajun]